MQERKAGSQQGTEPLAALVRSFEIIRKTRGQQKPGTEKTQRQRIEDRRKRAAAEARQK